MFSWIFWIFFVSTLTIIFFRGGSNEKWFSTAIFANVTYTYFVNKTLGWVNAHPFVLVIDIMLLVFLLALMSKSRRYWPIWFAAFHSIAVATSAAFFIFPNDIPSLYINAQGFWFLPALMSMTVGVIMDSRQEI